MNKRCSSETNIKIYWNFPLCSNLEQINATTHLIQNEVYFKTFRITYKLISKHKCVTYTYKHTHQNTASIIHDFFSFTGKDTSSLFFSRLISNVYIP